MQLIKQILIACIIALSFVAIGCSRNGATSKMSLSIPTDNLMHQKSASTTTTMPPLQTVIVNVRPATGGTPIAQQQDYNGQTPASVDFVFNTVPSGDVLVQVLAVYANSGGGMQVKYGYNTVTVNGDTSVWVDLTTNLNITKQSYLAGRLQMPDGTYPNGTLLALFTPPNGQPQMTVDQRPIVAGWFNIFAVSGTGTAFDYILKETGAPIFSALNPDATATGCTAQSLAGGCPFNLLTSDRVKVEKPVSYSRSGDITNPYIQSNVQTEYVLGFFGGLAGGTRNVCYGNDIYEAMPRMFTDSALTTPLEVKFSSGSPSQVSISGGGNSSFTSSTLYTNGATGACSQTELANGTGLILNHTLLGDSDENFGGFSAPWMMVQPFDTNGNQYVSVVPHPAFSATATYAASSTSVTLTSTFAPAIGSTISGTGIQTGSTITAVTANGGGSYTLTLSLPTTISGSAVTIQEPYVHLAWNLLPDVAFTSPISLTAGSASLTIPLTAGPVQTGLYVRDQTNPSYITSGATLTSVTTGANYTAVLSSAPTTAAGSDTLSFSYLSGVEIWAKPTYNGQATTTVNSATVTIAPAYATSALIGLPISGNNIPANATIIGVSNTSTITISAQATGSGTGGVMIGSFGGGGGDHNDCTKLPSQGYLQMATVDPAIQKYDFTGMAGFPVGPNVGYQFALCAAVGTGTSKTYLGSYVTGQPAYSNDNNRWPFGWANATKTNSSGSEPTTGMNIASQPISSITFPAPGLTQLSLPASIGTAASDEIMVTIVAHGTGANDCGTNYAGAGTHAFARVLASTTTTITIPSGTWIDQLSFANLGGTPAAGQSFCYAQATRVAQYRSLNISSFSTTSAVATASLLSSENIVPIRVNGTMTISASNMSLDGTGYMGSTMAYGAGDLGPSNSSTSTGLGGASSTNAGGGAGYGSGGDGFGSSGTAGQSHSFWNGQLYVGLGGGGGGNASYSGGSGGGSLMLAAYNLNFSTGLVISENGQSAGVAGNAGGGGGGSISLMAGSITGSAPVSLSAVGGNSGTGGGGPGGGGFVSAMACSSTIAVNPSIAAGAVAGGAAAASPGLSEISIDSASLSSKPWCY